jgi:hypothetical protein
LEKEKVALVCDGIEFFRGEAYNFFKTYAALAPLLCEFMQALGKGIESFRFHIAHNAFHIMALRGSRVCAWQQAPS